MERGDLDWGTRRCIARSDHIKCRIGGTLLNVPGGPMASKMAAAWTLVLGLQRLGIDHILRASRNFARAGMGSSIDRLVKLGPLKVLGSLPAVRNAGHAWSAKCDGDEDAVVQALTRNA